MTSPATHTIVILSSDAVLRASLASLFEVRGHRVSANRELAIAPDAEAGCVIVDLDRPTHPFSSHWLETLYPGVSFVVLSGSPWAGPDTAAGLDRGYFLQKPVPALELAAMVEGLLLEQPLG